jgi:signal transduction histidine kinase
MNEPLRIEVQDQGQGIAPEDQELIFEKFRQATGPNNPLVKGTGLGLAIAKALVEEQGGHIGVQSSPGKGSTFFFSLPKWRYKGKRSEVHAS